MDAIKAKIREVGNSSPASATIKAPDFITKSGVFLTFSAKTKLPQTLAGDIQGTKLENGGILRSTLPLFQQHICNTFGGLSFVFIDNVGIVSAGGSRIFVTEISGNCHDVLSFEQNRSSGVPEGVGVDVGETEFGGKIPEPAGHGIGPGRTAVFTAKYIARFHPILTVLQFPLTLLLLKFLEQILVAFIGADAQLVLAFKVQYVLGVLHKGAAVVEDVFVFHALLILDIVTLSGFLRLPLGHTRFGFVDDPIPDAVAVRIAPSVAGDVERV